MIPVCNGSDRLEDGARCVERSSIEGLGSLKPRVEARVPRRLSLQSIARAPSQDHPRRLHCQHGPGQLWLGVWTEEGVCEVMDSYWLPLTVYEAPGFHEWIVRHWKYVVRSEKTLQA